MFMSSRARRDIQTEVAFLITCLKKLDEEDWGMLKRILKYLKGTQGLKLTLRIVDMPIAKWWVHIPYTVYEDWKGRTGDVMSLDKGVVTSFSTKQKINGKSSTEEELIGVDDAMPKVLRSKYFVKAQGYTVNHNTLF